MGANRGGRPTGQKNKKRTPEEKEALILEYYKSGDGYQRFAEQNGVSPSLFYQWVKRYEKAGRNGLYEKGKREAVAAMDSQREGEYELLQQLVKQQQENIELLILVDKLKTENSELRFRIAKQQESVNIPPLN